VRNKQKGKNMSELKQDDQGVNPGAEAWQVRGDLTGIDSTGEDSGDRWWTREPGTGEITDTQILGTAMISGPIAATMLLEKRRKSKENR
jgi:hypothetical protein